MSHRLPPLRAAHRTLNQGPFFGGATLDSTDASLAPKLYHASVALKHYSQYDLTAQYPAVAAYLAALPALPAWRNTDYGHDAILAGWARHIEEHKKQKQH